MSKSKIGVPTPNLEPICGEGYVISSYAPDRLFGTIFNVIEALGLSEKQEDSLKSLIRKQIWNVFEDAIFITSERHSEIRNKYYERKKEINGEHPMEAI